MHTELSHLTHLPYFGWMSWLAVLVVSTCVAGHGSWFLNASLASFASCG